MKEELTPVYLTDDDCLLFVEFQKRHAFIKLMDSLGVFNIKGGSVEVHFDKFGQILSVDIHNHYRV